MSQGQILQNSKTDLLSVRNPNLKGRLINNLAPGVNPQDAVNVSQLNAALDSIKGLKTSVTNLGIGTFNANGTGSAANNTVQDSLIQSAFPRSSTSKSIVATTQTFTPTVQFGGLSVGITYGTQIGLICKYGNVTIITVNIHLANKGSSTGFVTIAGFPGDSLNFCVSPLGYGSTDFFANGALNGPAAFLDIGATSCVLNYTVYGLSAITQLQDTDFLNTTGFKFQFTYIN